MKRYIYIERDDLSDRGCNKGVEVYQLKRGAFPIFVGSNYRLDSAAWKGYLPCAGQIVHEATNCAFDGYRIKANNIKLVALGSAE